MKKWMMILTVMAFSAASGLQACAAMDAASTNEAAVKTEKKQCSYKAKTTCDWSECPAADCEKHAWLWDNYSVSDFYEISSAGFFYRM
jgi:hypothetical protein